MAELRVVNASPLIVLARAGHLDLLVEPGGEVLVPSAVFTEVLAGPNADPARRALEDGWARTTAIDDIPPSITEWGLGAGESEVLALTRSHEGATAVLDDAQARRCARAHGIPLLGTLGVVLRAARTGRIPAAAPVVRSIREAGLYVDDDLVRTVLAEALDEEWLQTEG